MWKKLSCLTCETTQTWNSCLGVSVIWSFLACSDCGICDNFPLQMHQVVAGEGWGEQGALFGNGYGFVCIKVVSPRGSNQEYRQGVLSTLSTHLPRGRARCRHREVPSGRNRPAAPNLGCFLPVLIFGRMLLQRRVWPVSFCDTSRLVMRCSLKVSMGDKRRCGRNDSQCVPVAITCSSWCQLRKLG